MKICLVGPAHPLRGGIAHYTSLLARSLSEDHEVLLISMRRQYLEFFFPGRTQYDTSRRPIAAEGEALLDSVYPWTWMLGARRIRAFGPDRVVFQWWHPFFAPMYASVAGLSGTAGRNIFLCHNVMPHERSRVDQALIHLAFSVPDGFIVHAEADREKLRRIRPQAPVRRTPHPEYAVFSELSAVTRQEARARLGLSPQERVILFFGYIRPYKGLGHLIKAMAIARRSIDCTLLVAGEFYEERSHYDRLVNEYSFGDRVRLEDRYIPNEDVAIYFQAADLVVLPYLSATQSGIVQIAYGFDKPVVVTDVGGMAEVVQDGETGFVVPSDDPEALAASIVRFFREEKGADFSERIRESRAEFQWPRLVRVIEELLS